MTMDILTILMWIIVAILIFVWIWAIYDVIFVSDISAGEKIFWVVIMLIFSYIGILFYVLLGRKESDYKIIKRR